MRTSGGPTGGIFGLCIFQASFFLSSAYLASREVLMYKYQFMDANFCFAKECMYLLSKLCNIQDDRLQLLEPHQA